MQNQTEAERGASPIARIVPGWLRALPLLGAISLLRFLPQMAESSLGGAWPLPWRLDALTLCFAIALPLGVAFLPLSWRNTLRALVALALLVAVAGEHLLVLPVALIILGGLLWSWRWLLAGALLAAGIGLIWLNGGSAWSAPATATAVTSPAFLLILLGCSIGLSSYPIALMRQSSDPLRQALQPIWLLPLIRTIEWGPWNSGWTLAALLLGGVTTLWAASTALWTDDRAQRIERILSAWLGMALACVGLLTTVGIAAALWLILAYALSLGLLLRSERWGWWAGPVPPAASFVAAWLAQGATAASGAFLLSAVFWLATLFSGIAILRLRSETKISSRLSIASALCLGLALLLGVLAPLPLRWLMLPAIEPLQGGLTPFGLLDIWPWVGIAALDAGHRRVAVLPSIAVFVLALVVAALVWLVARVFGWVRLAGDEEQNQPEQADLWVQLRQQVWWIKGSKRRG
ncbi:MAG TPA: hypothetical protein VGD58_20290 [Herpetosiphonaceae bacterium]